MSKGFFVLSTAIFNQGFLLEKFYSLRFFLFQQNSQLNGGG